MSQQQEEVRNVELPDECWELIFNRLGDDYRFEVISLVSKQFLSVSSCLKRSLTIDDPTIRFHCNLSHLFRRFHRITHVRLSCAMSEQEFNGILLDISRSGLDLEKLFVLNWTKIDVHVIRELGSNMNKLTNLSVGYRVLKHMDLVAVASSMPRLQALDINPSDSDGDDESDLTGEEIEGFASKVTQLRRINMSESHFVTDKLLIALCLNCEFLSELVVGSCDGGRQLTENGIGFALRHCRNLMSLILIGIHANSSVSSVPSTLFSFENSISYARALCELQIHNRVVSDALLCSIAKARLPLKKLGLCYCKDMTYSGLSCLLHEYRSITHLKLQSLDFLTDSMINDLSMFISKVTHLEILGCDLLTHKTVFILTGKCPFLVELSFQFLRLRQEDDFGLELTENHSIRALDFSFILRALDFSFIRSLNGKFLKKLGLVCPNIQCLKLSHCANIMDEGIGEILKSCSKLTHLHVNLCNVRRLLGPGLELSELKLEVLQASYTGIDDEGMAIIGARCPELLRLELNNCAKVTKVGVEVVLKKCINLREINLSECNQVNFDVVPWMIATRPSLRKIFPPGGELSKEEQRNLFLRHGCMFCNHSYA